MQEHTFLIDFKGSSYQGIYIREPATAAEALSKLMQKDCLFAVDTETMPLPEFMHLSKAGLSPHLSVTRLLQVFDGTTALVFDLKFIDAKRFIPFLSTKRFIAHYAVFDLQYFKRMGVEKMNIGCTLLLANHLFHAIYPTDEGLSASLANLVERMLDVPVLKKMQVSDWHVNDLSMEQIEYAALDAICVLKLAEKLAIGMQRNGLEKIYALDKAVQHPVVEMQLAGIGFNVPHHRTLIHKWRDELIAAEREVQEVTGLKNFTPAGIGEYLKKTLAPEILRIWPRTENTKTDRLSTDANTLDMFDHLPVVAPYSRYQRLEKLASTYGIGLIHAINPVTNRIHCGFNINKARTGRFSAVSPNIQNQPRSKDIRSSYIPAEGKYFVLADYSAIEVRAIAEESQDQNMIAAFNSGYDIYQATAGSLLKKPIESVTREERQSAKALILGMNFGMGWRKLGKYAEKNYGVTITDSQAEDQVSAYRRLYPRLREWQKEQVAAVEDNGFKVNAPFGKIRQLEYDNYYGAALNHPIQSGCASMMKCALVNVHEKKPSNSDIVLSVHDEIVLECGKDEVEESSSVLETEMTKAYRQVYPNAKCLENLVKASSGQNWAEAKE